MKIFKASRRILIPKEVTDERQRKAEKKCAAKGHRWAVDGGTCVPNCDLGEFCGCFVEVRTCTRCGDCDYGDTPDAKKVLTACQKKREAAEIERRMRAEENSRLGLDAWDASEIPF